MHLKGHYANPETTKTLAVLVGLAESDAVPRRPAEASDTHIRLTSDQTAGMCEAFLAGNTMTEIGLNYGVDRTTVRRYLVILGLLN